MAEIFVCETNPSITKKSKNWFSKFCCFFKRKSNCCQPMAQNILILEWTSRLLTKRELDLIVCHLPEDSYQTNANKTIYSLKSNGKPFYIDSDEYNYDIYFHQTNNESGIYFCDKHRDLMYVLRVLFYGLHICQTTRTELKYILDVLPKNYYEVNANQTIYSFKMNGKPFFIDKSQYIKEYHSLKNTSNYIPLNNEIIEETDFRSPSSESLGKKFAERNRLVFIKLKNSENNSKQKSIEILRNNNYSLKSKVYSSDNCSDKRRLIPQNGKHIDPEEVIKRSVKWSKCLANRRVYQKSELMIRTISSKEAKHILNKCKESLFDWTERNERRKRLQLKAKLNPVINCDLLRPTLYAICEVIEPNDVNHNPND